MKTNKGFTLIELMMAMFIMAAITTLVSTTIHSSLKNKKKLENRILAQAAIYDAIRIFRSDVEKAFHYQDFFFEVEKRAIEELNKAQGKSSKKNTPPQTGGNSFGSLNNEPAGFIPVPKAPPKLTHFLGENESLHFTSLNNVRTQVDVKESDQMEVGYFVDDCNARRNDEPTKCLFRRTDPYIDDDVEKGGRRLPLVEHITEFKLEYKSDIENDDWVDQWRSDNRGRPTHQNRFPHFIKLVIETHDKENPNGLKIKETMVVSIFFPNNDPLFPPETKKTNKAGTTR